MTSRTNDCPPKRQREEMCRDPSVWTVVPGALLLIGVGCVGTICKQAKDLFVRSRANFTCCDDHYTINPRTFSFSGIRDEWRASHRSRTSLWTLASTSAGPAAASSAVAVECDEKHREAYALGCAITERPRIACALGGTEDDMEAPLRTSMPRRLAAAAVEPTATSMVEV